MYGYDFNKHPKVLTESIFVHDYRLFQRKKVVLVYQILLPKGP